MTVARALDLRGVRKTFGATVALDGVDLYVETGERHALIGENGAGKSTLIRILAGLVRPDEGEIHTPPDEHGAQGVAVVHQELALAPTLSVAENLVLGNWPTQRGLVSRRLMHEQAESALGRIGLDLDVRRPVGELPLSQRQMVEIARALRRNPRALLLDEPTSSLTPSEVSKLFGLVEDLAASGTAVIFVSHRLQEIYDLCESATVLRDGRVVDRVELAATPPETIVAMMVGRELAEAAATTRLPVGGESFLEVSGLEGPGIHNVRLSASRGEILGLTGLAGAGQSQAARALAGLHRIERGVVRVAGEAVRIRSPRDALRAGVVYVPGDRHSEGVALPLTIQQNLVLPSLGRLSRFGVVDRHDARAAAERAVERLDIRPPRPGIPLSALSGGNQQKVVIGKWLESAPRVLVMDDPTRGVDVGAKATIHEVIRELARGGATIVFISSELTEVLALADRLLVFRDGFVAGELIGDECTEHNVMSLATGATAEAS